jgi:predicted DNA-binding helix-hairpin-helix protein
MAHIIKKPDTLQKLKILAADSQYDLACACGSKPDDQRTRSPENQWIYPVTMADGRKTYLFKTMTSNVCTNTCRYCPLRVSQDPRRCCLEPAEVVKSFFEFHRAGLVSGIFLTSGMQGTPDRTMERLITTARLLRQQGFKDYLHLKIIPGASNAAIEDAVSLSSMVSLNIETAGEKHFKVLSSSKDYQRDIIRPLQLISQLTGKGGQYRRVRRTTQFVVGAAEEKDQELVRYSWGLYKKLKLNRIYFSAYQRGQGEPDLPGEHSCLTNQQLLMREHRLYQTDWLLRKYGFTDEEIPFDAHGNLSLTTDPKELWAQAHPEFFPVNINRASRQQLLRVPGLGLITVQRVLDLRKKRSRIRSMTVLGPAGKRLHKARQYIKFD